MLQTLQGGLVAVSGALGSASTRLENYVVSWGEFAYGGDPELDALFQKQARERDPKRCTNCNAWCTSASCLPRSSRSPG